MAATYLGDVKKGTKLYHKWTTNQSDGHKICPTNPGGLWIYKDDSLVEYSGTGNGIAYSPCPFDNRVGLHHVTIDTSYACFVAGHDYQLIWDLPTVDGKWVIAVLLEFSVENRSTQDIYNRLGAPAGASVSADIAAIVAAMLDEVIDGVAWKDHVAITSASAAGDLSGAASSQQVIRQLNGSAARITADTDQHGNRTITLTLP